MTTSNNDIRTRIEDMRGILQCAEHTSETNEGLQAGYEANCGDVIQLSRPEYNQLFCLLSDLERLVPRSLGEGGILPSDSDARKALEIVDYYFNQAFNNVAGGNATISFQYLETIRAGILSLSAQLAEKEGEVERLREKLKKPHYVGVDYVGRSDGGI